MAPEPDSSPPAGARGKRRARPRRKRDNEVVDAAAKVFYERGYAGATVQDVADELGILKGSVYHYIDTKEDLLFRLFEQAHNEVGQIVDEVATAEDLDPLAQLARYVRRQVLHNLANVELMAIYYHEMERLSSERRSAVIDWRRLHERFLAGLIEQAQAAGLAHAGGDPALLANCVFATIIWPYRWYRPDRDGGPEAIADICVAYVLAGVTGPVFLAPPV